MSTLNTCGEAKSRPETASTLLTAREIAMLLNVSERHVWRMRSCGKLPEPIKVGRAARWTWKSISEFIQKGGTANAR